MENEVYKGKILAALNAVMADIGPIAKSSYNEQQKFNYRGIEAVLNALQPLLIKHKVIVVPTVIEHTREERTSRQGSALTYSVLTIKYDFIAEDGSFISTTIIGEGMDSGDKASNKAMSVAYKYACFQVLSIPTKEMVESDSGMVDPDSESHEVEAKKTATSHQRAPSPKKPAATPAQADAAPVDFTLISTPQAKRMFAISGGNEKIVRSVLDEYGYEHSKDVKKADYENICNDIAALV